MRIGGLVVFTSARALAARRPDPRLPGAPRQRPPRRPMLHVPTAPPPPDVLRTAPAAQHEARS